MPQEGFSNEEFRRSFGLPGVSGIQGPQEGWLGALEVLSYPGYAVSEATQAIGAGEGAEGFLRGLGRGITGKRKFGPLGEYLIPEAKKPGFQPEDIAAFGVDILTDPLMWAGPGLAKIALKPVSKLILAGGRKLVPEVHQILKAFPEKDYLAKNMGGLAGDVKAKAKLLAGELKELELSPVEALRRVVQTLPDRVLPEKMFTMHHDGLINHGEKLRQKIKTGSKMRAFDLDQLNKLPEDIIDMMRAGIRSVDANFRPGEMTMLQKGIQDLATRWAPAGAALKYFGGRSGQQIARMYSDAMASTRIREGAVMARLEQIVRGQSTSDLLQAVAVREGKGAPATPQIQKLADDLGQLLDEHFDDLVGLEEVIDPVTGATKMVPGGKHYDRFNNEIQVIDFTKEVGEAGYATPLSANRLPNYYPHKLDPKWFGNWKGLRAKLLADNIDAMKVDEFIRRMQYRPDKVGHIELKRQVGDLFENMYERDPRKVLPAYFRDSIMRQELGKQFGFGHEILDNLAGDLKNFGLRSTWVDDLTGALTGKGKRYDQALAKWSGTLNSVQAITKLGVATSVANFSQSPLNHVIRNGYVNYVKSLWKAGVPVPNSPAIVGGTHEGVRKLGLAAYNRGMQEQIRKMVSGGVGGPLDRVSSGYMKGIGFNWTERYGRMVGAVGGKLEIEDMVKQWNKFERANPGGGKGKRVVSELMRKYNIDGKMLRENARFGDDGLPIYKDLYEEMVERGALKASDDIMHAFDVLDLPLGWRDPFWRSVLQFKSFGYKQMEFMGREVVQPALRYFASGGTEGTIGPLVRSAMMYPPMAMFVDTARDVVRNVPPALLWGEWDLKDPYWEDPHPMLRLWNDMLYVGSMGLMGDAIEQAERGKLSAWMLGPTIGEGVRLGEETIQGRLKPGKVATRFLPGTLALDRSRSIANQAKDRQDWPFEWLYEKVK